MPALRERSIARLDGADGAQQRHAGEKRLLDISNEVLAADKQQRVLERETPLKQHAPDELVDGVVPPDILLRSP